MTRSLWSSAAMVAACLAVVTCRSDRHHEPGCAPGAFRACAHPCGHGVEQCLESGAGWTDCTCVIVDVGLPMSDAGIDHGGVTEDANAEDTGADASDSGAADATDSGPTDANGSDVPDVDAQNLDAQELG
jgi:hypothetical protein